MSWVLFIVFLDVSVMPHVSWHRTYDDCQGQAAVEIAGAIRRRTGVQHIECRLHHRPTFRPATGEILTRHW